MRDAMLPENSMLPYKIGAIDFVCNMFFATFLLNTVLFKINCMLFL